MQTIAVVDYGMGNLRSVAKAVERAADGRASVRVTQDAAGIAAADRVVFPGQGAIRDCIAELDRLGVREAVLAAARDRPFLGICMGLQALMDSSEEHAGTAGLGLCAGVVRRFPDAATDPRTGERLKVPHMGWNTVDPVAAHPLWDGIAPGERFYFVHSYYVDPQEPALVAATSDYAVTFCCALARENLFAVQFHPEKSQRAGLSLLANFVRWRP